MMSRLAQLFSKKKNRVVNVYCTAGYPELEDTLEVMKALQENAVDIIELGMPYSDPLADGPVIQQSSSIALRNGMTINKLFEQLKDFRNQIHTPVVLMGYLNPILQFGFQNFCRRASEVGIDGMIIPDLPVHEFEKEYGSIIKAEGLDFIFLITPETSDERIRKMDSLSSGFLYAVSSSSTTGGHYDQYVVNSYLKRIKEMGLKNPFLVGFGIRDKKSFDNACLYANGAIIGSAYINALQGKETLTDLTKKFLHEFKS